MHLSNIWMCCLHSFSLQLALFWQRSLLWHFLFHFMFHMVPYIFPNSLFDPLFNFLFMFLPTGLFLLLFSVLNFLFRLDLGLNSLNFLFHIWLSSYKLFINLLNLFRRSLLNLLLLLIILFKTGNVVT